jgi:hypothetical protein
VPAERERALCDGRPSCFTLGVTSSSGPRSNRAHPLEGERRGRGALTARRRARREGAGWEPAAGAELPPPLDLDDFEEALQQHRPSAHHAQQYHAADLARTQVGAAAAPVHPPDISLETYYWSACRLPVLVVRGGF